MKIKNIKVGPNGELFFYDTLREYRFVMGLCLILSCVFFGFIYNRIFVFPNILLIIIAIASIWLSIKNPPLLTITDTYIKFRGKKEMSWSQISSVDYKRDSVGNQCFDFLTFTTKDNQTYKLNLENMNYEGRYLLMEILKKHGFIIKIAREIKINNIKVGPNGKVCFYSPNDGFGVAMMTLLIIVAFLGFIGALFVMHEKGWKELLPFIPAIFLPLILAFSFKIMLTFAIEDSQDGKNSIVASDNISWQQIANITYDEKDNVNLLIFKTQDDKEYKLDITALSISKKELLMKVLREHGLK